MRTAILLATLLTLIGAVHAQDETRRPEHDNLGFPITFNTKRVTRSDALRSMGSPTDPADGSVASARDKLVMDMITERMAEIWGIRIMEADVQREIRREIEHRGGEAKFHKYLSQRGDTLARYEDEKRLQLVRYSINFLITNGISPPPEQKVLPWAVRPSPEEVRRAIKADSKRLEELGSRARGVVLGMQVDGKSRVEIVKRVMKDKTLKLEEELARHATTMAQKIIDRLDKGEPFLEVAKDLGIDAERDSKIWVSLPKEPSDDPAVRFFQTGKPKTHSGVLQFPGGLVKIAYLIERAAPASGDKLTPELYARYMAKILALRREKVRALMRLHALDHSSLGPRFYRKQFRADLVADLRAAINGLKALGLR